MMLAVLAKLPIISWPAILPETIFIGGALLLLAVSALSNKKLSSGFCAVYTILISVAALGSSMYLWDKLSSHSSYVAMSSSIAVDGFGVFVAILVCSITVLIALAGEGFFRDSWGSLEFFVLIMLSSSGAILMAMANDLIVVFLGLEIMSISLYVMTAMDPSRTSSGEAAIKYFLLGGFSSAIFIYGIALIYGSTGSTNLANIATFLADNVLVQNGVLLCGIAFLIVGFAFKVALVPFHMWTPDVYQGAPTPATSFMAALAKAGGFAAFLRVFFSTFGTLRSDWRPIIWVLAVLTLLIGVLLALVQQNIKRMLAYSSISHAGFVLLGLQAASAIGVAGSLYYLFTYSFLVIGSFTVVMLVAGEKDTNHSLDSYKGLARRRPWLAGVFTLLLLAQAGVPFTTGFMAKLYVLSALISAHGYALAVIAMIGAAIAVFFYLRVVVLMYSPAPGFAANDETGAALDTDTGIGESIEVGDEAATIQSSGMSLTRSTALVLAITVGITVAFGINPAPLIEFARHATLLFH
ncbi:MAG: NADH-quinone oxidoreductase subunit N [Actinobacteria bacterium]|nr:NADH-quinone oxidoreductase subunit N [Actinomycetota bacterium]MCL6105176.1 NADH-quinone oxidoreductase subunit N [Actinomycetota bacterium]